VARPPRDIRLALQRHHRDVCALLAALAGFLGHRAPPAARVQQLRARGVPALRPAPPRGRAVPRLRRARDPRAEPDFARVLLRRGQRQSEKSAEVVRTVLRPPWCRASA
jgi:hypothetical protein